MAGRLGDREASQRRRRLQFSVRGLLLMTVVVAVIAIVVRLTRQEAQFHGLERFHVNVHRNGSGDVVELSFHWSFDDEINDVPIFADDDTHLLRKLTGLKALDLERTEVTDAGLADVAELASLERLNLRGLAITDAGLASLADLPRLKRLCLDGTRITDAGLVYLNKIKTLRYLSLCRTAITDGGVQHLQEMQQLEYLAVTDTRITQQGLERLRAALPDTEL